MRQDEREVLIEVANKLHDRTRYVVNPTLRELLLESVLKLHELCDYDVGASLSDRGGKP